MPGIEQLADNLPSWWRDYDHQIERAQQKFGKIWLPKPPVNFVPRPGTKEVPLLHVPDSFDSLWDKVEAPAGYNKHRREHLDPNTFNLRLAPNKTQYVRPVWLVFNPEHGGDVRPSTLWGQDEPAASEVLSALIQFPEWSLTWDEDRPLTPRLAGYQIGWHGDWPFIPYICRWDGDYHQLILDAIFPKSLDSARYVSPSVRKCRKSFWF